MGVKIKNTVDRCIKNALSSSLLSHPLSPIYIIYIHRKNKKDGFVHKKLARIDDIYINDEIPY